MSTLVLKDCTTWVDSIPLTTYANELQLTLTVDDLDVTTFGSGGFKQRAAGLRNVEADLKGFWDGAVVDADAFANLGVINRVVSITPDGAAGSAAYLFKAGNFSYDQGGAVGAADPFTLKMMGSDGVGVVRGQLAAAKGSVSATGVLGSGQNLGAVSSTQFLYAAFHVFPTVGTTITVLLESDDNSGFTTPTTVATLGPLTAVGGTWMPRVAGPLTDTWFRFKVSAITGTFVVAGSIAVQ
ncbi:MAG: hypothetical protein JWN52_8094 [Actinomycetia bacterium]|nr:hypothetical protein [Actinomycetes bacterium]